MYRRYKLMGGRGAWAIRNRVERLQRSVRGLVLRREQRTFGGGGGFENPETIGGSKVGGSSNEQIKAALGAKFSRAEVLKIVGAPAGSQVQIIASGSSVSIRTTAVKQGFASSFRLDRDSQGVTFVGSSLFSSNASKASGGAAIRGFAGGLKYAVQNKLVNRALVPSAIGGAGDRSAQGSSLWARMGASTNLSNINGLAARPKGLRRAKTVADLMTTKAGRTWWNANRKTFRGEIDFRRKGTNSYKLAKRFLGLRTK
jgi:hypothetical protein